MTPSRNASAGTVNLKRGGIGLVIFNIYAAAANDDPTGEGRE